MWFRCASYCIGTALLVFFFNDPATTEIYTLSLHDALPISSLFALGVMSVVWMAVVAGLIALEKTLPWRRVDRKSTRLNSSHVEISYAVFCLKKKKRANTSASRRH